MALNISKNDKRELKKPFDIKIKKNNIIMEVVTIASVNLIMLNVLLGLWVFVWIILSVIIYLFDNCEER